MKLLYSSWMKQLDTEAINTFGIPSIVLMENASQGAARFFAEEFPAEKFSNAIILVGKGNNGGDGIACGRILAQQGYHIEYLLLCDPKKLNADPRVNYHIIKKLKLNTARLVNKGKLKVFLNKFNRGNTFIIDAVFGTGIKTPLKDGFYSAIFDLINNSGFYIASIDIPSGLSDSFLPEQGAHIIADITATFQNMKLAHIYPDGNSYCGKINIIDIGIPRDLIENDKYYINFIEPSIFEILFKRRDQHAHKGNFGHCLNIAGSTEKPGAGILSSYASLKSGAGLCTIAVKDENRAIAVTAHPELMTLIYNDQTEIQKRLHEFDVALLGPGMGNSQLTLGLLTSLIENASFPLIIDADGINVLAGNLEILAKKRDFPIIITPHPGEFAKLTGCSIEEITRNRIPISRDYSKKYNLFIVLKGHHTLVVTPQGKVFINQTGNPGMATAGSGDVLGGMIAGLISQFYHSFNLDIIIAAAVFVHGFSGDLAVRETGELSLTAGDIINFIPRAIVNLNEFRTNLQFS